MKKPQDRGPLTLDFERRYGYNGLPGPGGVFTQGSPASCPPNKFLVLHNVRWEDDAIVPRGGQLRLTEDPIHDPTAHIHPSQFITGSPNHLWITGDGCPGESAGVGFYVGHYDPDQEPQVQRATWYADGPPPMVGQFFYGGSPHVIVGTELRRYEQVALDWNGSENLTLAGSGQDRPLATLPAYGNAGIEHAGLALILCNDGSIQSWDGKTLRQDLAPVGGDIPIAAGLFRDTCLIGYAGASNKISVRAADGTYTHVAGAGTATRLGRNSICSYKDNAYGVSGATTIWKYDGTTLTPAFKTIVGAVIESIEAAFGYLYAGYYSGTAKLARYDNATWVDSHKDFSAEAAATTRVPGLRYHKDRLAAMVIKTAAATLLLLSPQADTSGTYELQAHNGDLSNDVRYLLTPGA